MPWLLRACGPAARRPAGSQEAGSSSSGAQAQRSYVQSVMVTVRRVHLLWLPWLLFSLLLRGGLAGPYSSEVLTEPAAGEDQEASKRVQGKDGRVYVEDVAATAKREQYIDRAVRRDVQRALDTYLRCEACQAVAFQVLLEFNIAERKSGSARGQLSADMVEFAMDEGGACSPEHYEAYVLRNINGSRYLVGAGMTLTQTSTLGTINPGNVTLPLAIRCVDVRARRCRCRCCRCASCVRPATSPPVRFTHASMQRLPRCRCVISLADRLSLCGGGGGGGVCGVVSCVWGACVHAGGG
jgi:hypothetical protein